MFYSGSDDFRVYAWKLPTDAFLRQNRETRPRENQVCFGQNSTSRIVPVKLEESYTLKNHRSIVNSVIHHPFLPAIYTAGVEKVVRVFSPFSFANEPGKCNLCFLLNM